jgi:hypothetical protein
VVACGIAPDFAERTISWLEKGVMSSSMMLSLWKNIGFVALIAVLCGSLLLNVTLILRKGGSSQHPSGIAVGSDLRGLRFIGDGAPGRIDLKGGPTIFYIMKPGCVWCIRNRDNIQALAKQVGSTYGMVGLSSTDQGLKEHLLALPLPFKVYALDLDHLPNGVDPTVTPQLVVVGSNGIVEKVWIGALGGRARTEVEEFFHVTLPGLSTFGEKARAE